MTKEACPKPNRKQRNFEKLRAGLDEEYINELRKDPVKWEEFRRAGKALFRAVHSLKRTA